MDSIQYRTLSNLWWILLRNKEIYVKRIHSRIPKDKLSKEDLEKPEISKQVKEFGYYDVVRSNSSDEIKILEQLTELGYLEKRTDKVYKVQLFYEAHPYIPHIGIDGHLGLQLNSRNHFGYHYFNSKRFENFVETAKLFGEGMEAGLHRHIRFGYSLDYSYETEVYEIKDKYFDAIFFGSVIDDKIAVGLAQPFIQTRISNKETKYMKNWKKVKEITIDDFLVGPSRIDPMIDELDWKKKMKGYLMYEDQPYTLLVEPKNSEEEEHKGMLSSPDFFDTGEFSPESMRSRLFEEVAANYIRSIDYVVKTRVQYFGKEIDIFSEKLSKEKKDMIICECKLRMEDSPLTIDELQTFNDKKELVIKHEFFENCEFWMISNTEQLIDGVKKYADEHDIKIKVARLPRNWKARSDWSINKLDDWTYSEDNRINE